MSVRLEFMLITASVPEALRAQDCGVARIFVDREWLGKVERQGHVDTHKAVHELSAVEALSAALTRAEVMVRINPPGPQLAIEVDEAIAAGAQRLMLPMFGSVAELGAFIEAVAGRVPVTPLFETPASLSCLPECLPLLGPADTIMFGLNDLSLAAGDRFLFAPWARGDLDAPTAACREAGVPFGIGGVARIGEGELPAEWVIGEHVRIGSSWVILSRAFREGAVDLAAEVERVRTVESGFRAADAAALADNHDRFIARVRELDAS